MTTEDWQAELLRRVTERPRDRSRVSRKYGAVLNLSPELWRALDAACETVDLNRSAYTRNALAVQIAHHQNLDAKELMATTPMSTGWDRYHWTTSAAHRWPKDQGQHLHLFCPHPGCDGSHY